jgi:hypothetical protein
VRCVQAASEEASAELALKIEFLNAELERVKEERDNAGKEQIAMLTHALTKLGEEHSKVATHRLTRICSLTLTLP